MRTAVATLATLVLAGCATLAPPGGLARVARQPEVWADTPERGAQAQRALVCAWRRAGQLLEVAKLPARLPKPPMLFVAADGSRAWAVLARQVCLDGSDGRRVKGCSRDWASGPAPWSERRALVLSWGASTKRNARLVAHELAHYLLRGHPTHEDPQHTVPGVWGATGWAGRVGRECASDTLQASVGKLTHHTKTLPRRNGVPQVLFDVLARDVRRSEFTQLIAEFFERLGFREKLGSPSSHVPRERSAITPRTADGDCLQHAVDYSLTRIRIRQQGEHPGNLCDGFFDLSLVH